MGKIKILNEDLLYNLYINKDMTSMEIASEIKSGNNTVCRELNRYGLVKQKRETKRKIKNKRLYRIWQGMKTRCYNENDSSYKWYGEQGVKICKEWLDDFENFYKWSITNGYNDKLTIDRINFNGNYEPNNCRWVDYNIQNNNKSNNILLQYKNKEYSIKEAAEETGLNESTIRSRLNSGWSDEKIFSIPTLDYGIDTVKNKSSSKPVKQISKNGEILNTFESIRDASKQTNINYSSICKNLKNKLKSAGGFIWEYKD